MPSANAEADANEAEDGEESDEEAEDFGEACAEGADAEEMEAKAGEGIEERGVEIEGLKVREHGAEGGGLGDPVGVELVVPEGAVAGGFEGGGEVDEDEEEDGKPGAAFQQIADALEGACDSRGRELGGRRGGVG